MVYLKVLSFNGINTPLNGIHSLSGKLGGVIRGVKDNFSSLVFSGNKYLVIEVLDHHLQVTFLKADLEKKKIRIIKNWDRPFGQLSIPSVVKDVAKIFKKIRKPSKCHIVLNLDSNLATTIYSSASLVRQNPSDTIDEADIDNLISQAIWRFFDRQRMKVAKKMGINDIDVLLSDVRIRGVKLDGHKVINPIGFASKSVEFYFSQTFVPRDFIRALREAVPLDQIVFMAEAGTVLAHNALNILKDDHLFLVNLFPNQTVLYKAQAGKLAYLDKYPWGQKDLLASMENHLQTDSGVSARVIDLYNKNTVSPAFSRRLENILIKETQLFLNGLDALVDENPAKIYFNPYFNIPVTILNSRFQNRSLKNLKISELSQDLIADRFGFEVKLNQSVQLENPLMLLAVLSEMASLPKNDKLSYLAKRRVRWLS